jgi:hypothetical protein
MKDKGLNKKLVQDFNTSSREHRGQKEAFFGFRKMFWDYLNKLNVAFYDACCEDASADADGEEVYPTRYNYTQRRLEYFNGTEWVDIAEIVETTTTTTTTSTTTTTTAP